MWCPTHARSPLARQNVLFSSAPQASSGARRRDRQLERLGHVAARAPQQQRPARAADATARTTESSVRVSIGRSCSRKRSAIAAEALERVLVLVGDRLVRHVAARHHERRRRHPRAAGGGAASTGSITPSSGEPGATAAATGASGSPRREHDRPLAGRAAAPRSRSPSIDQRARGREAGDHQRERLVLAVLAGAQRGHGALVVGAAGQVEAADSLHRDDQARRAALARPPRAGPSSRSSARRPTVDEPQRRPAVGAGVRLGVEAAIERILVLGAGSARTSRSRPSS